VLTPDGGTSPIPSPSNMKEYEKFAKLAALEQCIEEPTSHINIRLRRSSMGVHVEEAVILE
jgi:hypothetical protein